MKVLALSESCFWAAETASLTCDCVSCDRQILNDSQYLEFGILWGDSSVGRRWAAKSHSLKL
jgi:hypothetical protein